jgi:hypothetical protein
LTVGKAGHSIPSPWPTIPGRRCASASTGPFLLSMGTVFVATQVQSTVLGYQVYELTHDAFKLGLVG